MEIHIGEGQNLEKALRQFRRKVQRAGILADMRRKRRYEKPSEAKRRKALAAQRRSDMTAPASVAGVRVCRPER